jgi:hypothetical protein
LRVLDNVEVPDKIKSVKNRLEAFAIVLPAGNLFLLPFIFLLRLVCVCEVVVNNRK